MSSAQEISNKALYSRVYDAFNSGDIEVISKTVDEVFEPDALFHSPVPMDMPGPQAVKQVWTILLRAFPDIHVKVEDVITEGDKVVFRNTVTGTHQGEYRGIAPTGNSVNYREIFILRFVDGRVVEGWGVVDVFAQLQQIGAIQV